jgi:hypothetical protein
METTGTGYNCMAHSGLFMNISASLNHEYLTYLMNMLIIRQCFLKQELNRLGGYTIKAVLFIKKWLALSLNGFLLENRSGIRNEPHFRHYRFRF